MADSASTPTNGTPDHADQAVVTASEPPDSAATKLSLLTSRATETGANVAAVTAKGQEALDREIATCKDTAHQDPNKVQIGAREAKASISSQLQAIRKGWDKRNAKIHTQHESSKDRRSSADAEDHARQAESDAQDAVASASSALDEAYLKVLVAASARLALDRSRTPAS